MPDVHKIMNSLSSICLTKKIIIEIKKAKGINFGIIPNKFKKEYRKYVDIGYPLSTINSKKFTALTVQAIIDKPNNMTKKVFKISLI